MYHFHCRQEMSTFRTIIPTPERKGGISESVDSRIVPVLPLKYNQKHELPKRKRERKQKTKAVGKTQSRP